MESSENLSTNIETKLRLIKFTQEQAEKSVETNNVLAMGRQIKTLTTKVSEIHEIKVKIQELKIETAKISRIYKPGMQSWIINSPSKQKFLTSTIP